jgi:hypothetical protein
MAKLGTNRESVFRIFSLLLIVSTVGIALTESTSFVISGTRRQGSGFGTRLLFSPYYRLPLSRVRNKSIVTPVPHIPPHTADHVLFTVKRFTGECIESGQDNVYRYEEMQTHKPRVRTTYPLGSALHLFHMYVGHVRQHCRLFHETYLPPCLP